MNRRAFLATSLAAVACTQITQAQETMGEVVRLDPRLDKLIPPDAKIEKIAGGFDWAEGPVWDRRKEGEERLLFSDIPKNMVWQWSAKGGLKPFLKPSGYTGTEKRGGESGSNGLIMGWGHEHLILCQHGDRRIARLNDDGKTFTTLADRYEGKRFNSPNDLAIHWSSGNIFFTDPPYGLEKGADDPKREMNYCGVFRLHKDGRIKLMTKDLTRPNGIAISGDQKTLYVANSDPKHAIWIAYPLDLVLGDIQGDGKVFYDVTKEVGKMKGLPDGMKLDLNGNLFATGPGGVWVFTPKAEVLGRIDPGCATANCGWGMDGDTLFLTADKSLCRIETKTRGWDSL
ncbi:MAG: SMP-30/gluconolactonase/LRE family protein [Gemmatales bacterium]